MIACLRKRMEDCIESLRDANVVARCTAVRALGQMGASAREALPALIQALQDREALVRDAAAEAIGAIGPETREAIAALHQGGVPTVLGTLSFDTKGDVMKPDYIIYRWTKGEYLPLEEQ